MKLIIIMIKYTMKNLSLILKKNIFEKGQNKSFFAFFENIFFSMRLRFFIVYFIITLK